MLGCVRCELGFALAGRGRLLACCCAITAYLAVNRQDSALQFWVAISICQEEHIELVESFAFYSHVGAFGSKMLAIKPLKKWLSIKFIADVKILGASENEGWIFIHIVFMIPYPPSLPPSLFLSPVGPSSLFLLHFTSLPSTCAKCHQDPSNCLKGQPHPVMVSDMTLSCGFIQPVSPISKKRFLLKYILLSNMSANPRFFPVKPADQNPASRYLSFRDT